MIDKFSTFLLASLILPFSVLAAKVPECSTDEAEYILEKFTTYQLDESQTIGTATRQKLADNLVCEIRNELMNDGLAFRLYEVEENSVRFISVYNGLNGDVQTYGPFPCRHQEDKKKL